MTFVVGLPPPTAAPPVLATFSVVRRQSNPAPYGWRLLTVRSGDTLGEIAIRYGTTVAVLINRNHLSAGGHFIAAGRTLWAPRARPAPRTVARARFATYVVRSGDILGGIAVRYGVSLSALCSLNRIGRTAYIHPGQRLRVPAAAARARAKAAAPRAVSTRVVIVRSGDTLGGIAVRYGVSTASLLKANRLTLRSVLQIGQRVRVVTTARPGFSSNTFAGRTYAPGIVSAAMANRRYLTGHVVPNRMQTRALIVATARRHGVDPRLALAIAWQESGWNQRQVSVANAIGTMQVIPSSGIWASGLAGRRLNLLNTRDNVTAGVVILRSLSRSARTQNEAIAGYYQGLYSVQKNGMYADTKRYVASILLLRARM